MTIPTLGLARRLAARLPSPTTVPPVAYFGLDTQDLSHATVQPLDAQAVDLVLDDLSASGLIGKRFPRSSGKALLRMLGN